MTYLYEGQLEEGAKRFANIPLSEPIFDRYGRPRGRNMVTGVPDTVEVPHKLLPRLEATRPDEAGQLGAPAVSQAVEKPEQI